MCDECKILAADNAFLNEQLDAMYVRRGVLEQIIERLKVENQQLSNQYHRALFPLDPTRVTPSIKQQVKARLKANPRQPKVKVSETQASIIMSCLRSRRVA